MSLSISPHPPGRCAPISFRPAAEGRFPGVLLYSEIFQVTQPVRRIATQLAGNGYVVAVPEIYHEYEPLGTVLGYEQSGSDRGNALKTTKPLSAFDDDARTVLSHLASRYRLHRAPRCYGHLHRRSPRLSCRHEP